jgi:hypothetical protein
MAAVIAEAAALKSSGRKAAEDLMQVWDDALPNELMVSAGAELLVPEMPYNLDRKRPLPVAIDFSVAAASGISYGRVPPSRASAYWRARAEAALRKRSADYASGIANERFFFLGLVETGDVVRPR